VILHLVSGFIHPYNIILRLLCDPLVLCSFSKRFVFGCIKNRRVGYLIFVELPRRKFFDSGIYVMKNMRLAALNMIWMQNAGVFILLRFCCRIALELVGDTVL